MTTSYRLIVAVTWLLSRLWFRLRVIGVERVPLDGGVILAPNHVSYLDPFLVGHPVPRALCYLCRESAMRFPILGAMLKSWNAIPVDRDGHGARGLKAIMDALLAGRGVLLFPEGTRTRDGQMQSARSGIGLLVMKSGAPVVPVRIFGMWGAYNRHMTFPRPFRATVKYGEPLRFEALRAEAKTCPKERLKEIYQQVADEIMAAIAAIEADKG
jgi:1-acyl-sn-glycerol-3-phosphate acyltransferase